MLVTGILIKWIKVKARPIAIGAKPLGARSSVEPRMIMRKKAVNTTSINKAAVKL